MGSGFSMPTPETAVASAAISAGHQARHDLSQDLIRRLKVKEKEDEEPLTAERWICFVHHGMRFWEDGAAPGASTPLICLYYLGWIMGKHPFFLFIAFAAVLFSWGNFWVLSLEEGGANFWEMWVANVAVFFLHSACFFVWRVFKRVPRRSAGFWFALLLETGLVNTLTCVAHGVGFWLLKGGGWQDAKNDAAVLRLAAFSSPFVLWFALRRVVLARQDAFIRRNNLAAQAGREMCCARACAASPEAKAAAVLVVQDIIEKGMDLRMTGLSRKELGRLADCLGNESAAAVLIRFYTVRVDSREKFHLLLSSFHQGYEHTPEPDLCSGSDGLTKWCEDWAESSRDHPWRSVRQLAGYAEPPEGAPLRGCPCGHPKDQIWWLCGAIAKVSDMSMGTEHRQYALMAAALSINQDPLAIIMAGGRAAKERLRKMKKGCTEVLRQVDPDAQGGEEERGLVFTDVKEGDTPVVTYSPSEAWHAASVRGAFMLGREAFNSLWKEPGYHALNPEEINRLRRNDKEWSKRVETRVDLKPTFKFLGLKGSALADATAAARLGFWMHSAWVVCMIVIRPFYPRHLPYLAVMATLFLKVGKADQCAHYVFAVVHVWRLLPMGRICRALKPMSDGTIKDVSWNSFFVVAVVAINYGSVFFGQRYATPFDKAAFWLLLLVPLAPGLWHFVLGGRHSHVIKSDKSGAVVTCPARETGEKGGGGRDARCGISGKKLLQRMGWPAAAGTDEDEEATQSASTQPCDDICCEC